ncbi:phosphocholine cytidylyltransferase family protein [Myxococcota bacterium]|nr:phosphocholine cytidylyltransferase family protein [Myxococcota bacterium]MBU1537717.1 phosphocholine cytidylyltransferase family protein [Myxococcota bacterium]
MKAVILAAGRGSRLGDLTLDRPKPFIDVHGTPLILNALTQLKKSGITEVVIVIGYMADYFRKNIGESHEGLKVTYVENTIWESTNNSYSLLLARGAVGADEPMLIMEADIFFNRHFLEAHKMADEKSYWFCSGTHFTGSQVFVEADNRISRIEIIRSDEKLAALKKERTLCKSAGIVKTTGDKTNLIFSELEKFCSVPENVNYYYDVFFNTVIHMLDIYANEMPQTCWYEIDTQEDREEAERIIILD